MATAKEMREQIDRLLAENRKLKEKDNPLLANATMTSDIKARTKKKPTPSRFEEIDMSRDEGDDDDSEENDE